MASRSYANGPAKRSNQQQHYLTPSRSQPDFHPHPGYASEPAHPYGFMSSASVAPDDEEETCPVCNEDLSLRLEGEKPHIVPECGHRLREFPRTSPACSHAPRKLTRFLLLRRRRVLRRRLRRRHARAPKGSLARHVWHLSQGHAHWRGRRGLRPPKQ